MSSKLLLSLYFTSILLCLSFSASQAYVASGFDENDLINPRRNLGPEELDGDSDMDGTQVDGVYEKTLEDDNAHIIDQPSCTVIRVPLKSTGVEVHVEEIDNAYRMMLSTTPLVTCNQITDFQCPESADFCATTIIEDNSDLEIEDADCKHQYAYLYIEPFNTAENSAFEVFVTSFNEEACGANTNTNANQDNTNNQQSDTDDVSDWEFCGVLDEGDCQFDTKNCSSRCVWATCSVNQNGALNEVMASCVPRNATSAQITEICSSEDIFNQATPENQVINTTCPNSSDSSNVTPAPDNTQSQQTSGTDVSGDATNLALDDEETDELSDWDYCGVLVQENCQQDTNDCSSKCVWTTCSVRGVSDETGTCVPSYANNDDIVEICLSDETFKNAAPEDQIVTRNCPLTSTSDSGGAAPHHYLLIAFLILLGIFMCVVCIYRHQFRKNQVEIFNAPAWCPNFIFPRREHGGFSPIRIISQHDDYKPPVPVL